MGKDDLERSSREGKAREHSKRKSTGRRAEPNKEGRQFRRNDVLPTLRIESYPIEALKTHVRKLRKNDSAHIREIASSISRNKGALACPRTLQLRTMFIKSWSL